MTNAILLFILVLLQLGLAFYAFMHTEKMAKSAKSTFGALWRNREQHQSKIHVIQKTLRCCGYNGPKDWVKADLLVNTWVKVPMSCCEKALNCNKDNAFKNGCGNALFELIERNESFLEW